MDTEIPHSVCYLGDPKGSPSIVKYMYYGEKSDDIAFLSEHMIISIPRLCYMYEILDFAP